MRNDIQPSEGEDLVMEHTKTAWSGEKKSAPDFGGGVGSVINKNIVSFLNDTFGRCLKKGIL